MIPVQAPCFGGPLDGQTLPVSDRTPYFVIRHATRNGTVDFQYRMERFLIEGDSRVAWVHGELDTARVLEALQGGAP